MEFTVNLSKLHPEVAGGVIKSLAHEDRARHAVGMVEQLKLKKLHDAMADARALNTEIGRQNMVLSRDQWKRFMDTYGTRCWADPDFAPWVLKKPEHADLRVRDVGLKIQSGFTGKGDTRRG